MCVHMLRKGKREREYKQECMWVGRWVGGVVGRGTCIHFGVHGFIWMVRSYKMCERVVCQMGLGGGSGCIGENYLVFTLVKITRPHLPRYIILSSLLVSPF